MSSPRETTHDTTTTLRMQCTECGRPSNPIVYRDGRMLCRECAYRGQPADFTVECPFCHGTGRMKG